ncbi:UNVERIFIED_CONTAM: hypothetical protein GTU68_033727, partial [Idotea baltica]|nr:hypothetical protein [Idotea baltica]
RGAELFDKVVVGIGINPEKQPLFSASERETLMSEVFAEVSNIEVQCFSGLTVEFARQCQANVMLRGVRTVSDIEAEFTMALTNATIAPDLETVFLMASDVYSHISSTLIKQIATMSQSANYEQLEKFVPKQIIEPLLKKVKK